MDIGFQVDDHRNEGAYTRETFPVARVKRIYSRKPLIKEQLHLTEQLHAVFFKEDEMSALADFD